MRVGEGDQVASIAAFTMSDQSRPRRDDDAAPDNGGTAEEDDDDDDQVLNATIPLELDDGPGRNN